MWIVQWLIETYHRWEIVEPCHESVIIIKAEITQPWQTVRVNKYFSNSYYIQVDWGTEEQMSSQKDIVFNETWIHEIVLRKNDCLRRLFGSGSVALVPINWTSANNVWIDYIPNLKDWFGYSAEIPWPRYFYSFNVYWALTSLPVGSFDTSDIEVAGFGFFEKFNKWWNLESLPEWSFDISNIQTVEGDFFSHFNEQWNLESLPEWSFDTSNITWDVSGWFFSWFNSYGWKLKSLPEWSFDIR